MTSIHVPALMSSDRIVVPAFSLGNVEYRTDNRGSAFSAQEYHEAMQLPTLAELRHAYFDKTLVLDREKSQFDDYGNVVVPAYTNVWVSPEYRQSVLSNRGRGEWTSTFLRDGEEVIEKPVRVSYDKKHGLWTAEGGSRNRLELPPNGWTLEYDKPTGFPSRTSQTRKDAERVFGDDTSYFYANRNGLRAVLRSFLLGDDGSFYVDADYGPGSRNSNVGGRVCRRSEQDAKHLATSVESQPIYVMGQAEYDELARLAEKNPEAADLLSKIRVQERGI